MPKISGIKMSIKNDPFTENVLESLPDEVRSSLNKKQVIALRLALIKVHKSSRHLLDIRFDLPLYFTRYYLVFLFGKDRRHAVLQLNDERRKHSSRLAQLGFIAMSLWIFISSSLTLLFLLLYLIKSFMGIDIMPDMHLIDFFKSS